MANLIPFPEPDAEAHARAETERKRKLFAWAEALLQLLGLTTKVAQAQSVDDLRKITLDVDDVEVEFAIRDALHPAAGQRAEHFTGMKAGTLKRLLKTRFGELKKNREAELLGRTGTTSGHRSSPHNWTHDLKFDAEGGIRPILKNLILFLCEHPTWKGVIGFNGFAARVVIRKRPYWGDVEPDTPWTDHHETLVRAWFQDQDIAAAQGDVGRAIQAAARANCFHPVRDYLDALVWDGKSRIDTWLHVYLHAENTLYTRAVGPRFLISAVARTYQPGCQADYMLVLEGPQGQGKSKAVRTLAARDSWYADRLSHVGTKDAAQETVGIWLFEIAEMIALLRVAVSSAKSFVTRQSERYRPPYGKYTINHPRQCVFIGTINPPVGGYLRDTTGSRRTWPVACHGMIDLEALIIDRDQLWAEAVARCKAGGTWWLETPELEALATAEQDARFETDTWQEPIGKWVGKRKDTSISEVLEHVFGLAPLEQSQAAQNRVAKILTRLHYAKHRLRKKGGGRENRYVREKFTKQGVTSVTREPKP
jgi:predicted P-loop ATPase